MRPCPTGGCVHLQRNFYDATTMRLRNLSLLLVSVIGLMSSSCLAQIDLAGLSGRVGDSAGRRLQGAHIVAVQLATGLRREAISSATGVYDIPDLPIGLYRVTCSAPGFQDRVYDGLQQTVGHTSALDVSLGVAGVAQTVLSGRRRASSTERRTPSERASMYVE